MDAPQPTPNEQAEYDQRLLAAEAREAATPAERYIDGKRVIWSPLLGSQTEFMRCPLFECLAHGTRGSAKTDGFIMSFAQHVGRGHGAAWRGIVFRQTYPQLADVEAKTVKWFRPIFPGAKFNRASMTWVWPSGETLLLRHMMRPADYWNYHGHEYPFIGFEELSNWATDECYRLMISCCRSPTHGVPRLLRGTTNPYGVGHGWIKDRFKLHGNWMDTIIQMEPRDAKGRVEKSRCAIHSHIRENTVLLDADPDYPNTIASAAANPEMAKAWLDGSWDIVGGGIFSDVWRPEFNVVPNIPLGCLPESWRIDRAYDHGQSAPFSVGWYAESNGEPLVWQGRVFGAVPGDTFRIAEWYGWNGRPNEGLRMSSTDIAKGILNREKSWGIDGRCYPGPADTSIYTDYEPGKSVAGMMASAGVYWEKADKGPGSRKQGWERMREMLRNAVPGAEGERTVSGLFVFEGCDQFLRTVPPLPRSNRDLDDADTESEDHIGDEVRYRVRRPETVHISQYY
jgi:hypothetical protein